MAIGDGPNDLVCCPRPAWAWRWAMPHPRSWPRCEHVVAPSDQDGVAEAVRRFILEECVEKQ